MEREAVGTADVAQAQRHRFGDVTALPSSLALLVALAAAAFGQGAFSSGVRWFIVALIAIAFRLGLAARTVPVADLRNGFVLAGLLLGSWALVRAAVAGTLASGVGWALFGAGTAAVVSVSRLLDAASRLTLLGGVLAVGAVVATTGWLGVALHIRPLPAGCWICAGYRAHGRWHGPPQGRPSELASRCSAWCHPCTPPLLPGP